jgi:hypothetical protein
MLCVFSYLAIAVVIAVFAPTIFGYLFETVEYLEWRLGLDRHHKH